jgi:type III restriction enzyme
MLTLRHYQARSLDALDKYFRLCRTVGPKKAFIEITERPYQTPTILANVPYVCLRLPTGGGKTLLAAHAAGLALHRLLEATHGVVLWLVPSNTIRDQTLDALRNREHAYHQALIEKITSPVRVVDLQEALYLPRGVYMGETVVLVSTLAALRVEDTDGRKIYESNGTLSGFFSGSNERLSEGLDTNDAGIIPSLANAIAVHRPVVIMDEAHNARTSLSFATLERFSPSCVIEFTATPQEKSNSNDEPGSNVLHHVCAGELKAEDMIKLPIELDLEADWKRAISASLAHRRELEELARKEEEATGEYIRPIVLLQAQPRSKDRETLSVDVLKAALIADFHIPEEHIAIATGDTRELDGVDLFSRECKLRVLITQQALKEGWDCSFAYVFCSVADVGSSRAVEQLLGRVLRLPHAHRKQHEGLNRAYAVIASKRFADTANALAEALIQNGFQKFEAARFVEANPQSQLWPEDTLFHSASVEVSCEPALDELPEDVRSQVRYDPETKSVVVAPGTSLEHCAAIEQVLPVIDRPAFQAALVPVTRQSGVAVSSTGLTGSVKSAPVYTLFQIPGLSCLRQGRIEVFDESHFLASTWDLRHSDFRLGEVHFPSVEKSGEAALLDIDESGRMAIRQLEKTSHQLSFLGNEPGWDIPTLVNWLDRAVVHPDLPQSHSTAWINRVLMFLADERGLSVEVLARRKFELSKALEKRMDELRGKWREERFQESLFGTDSTVATRPEHTFDLDPNRYYPRLAYTGAHKFPKHFAPIVGDLGGEETKCAVYLEGLALVKRWVRNLERSVDSFWLQTSTDKFYPDFIAELTDGRILIIEYKGGDRITNDDSKEKNNLGKAWADRSGGKCLFLMVGNLEFEKIDEVIRG